MVTLVAKCFARYLSEYMHDLPRLLLSLYTTDNAEHRFRQRSAIKKTFVRES